MNTKHLPDIKLSSVDLPTLDDLAVADAADAVVDAAEAVVDRAGRTVTWVVDHLPVGDRRRPVLRYALIGAGALAVVVLVTRLVKRRNDEGAHEAELRQVA